MQLNQIHKLNVFTADNRINCNKDSQPCEYTDLHKDHPLLLENQNNNLTHTNSRLLKGMVIGQRKICHCQITLRQAF